MSVGGTTGPGPGQNIYLDMANMLDGEGIKQIQAAVVAFVTTTTFEHKTSDKKVGDGSLPPGTGTDPEIASPTLSPADAALVLAALRDKILNEQAKTNSEQVKGDQLRRKEMAAQNLKKIEEAIEKIKDSKKSGLLGKIFGWIGAIFMALAAALVVAVGVLTANPAMVVAGVMLAMGTALMVGMLIDQETGGKMMEGLGKMFAAMAKFFNPSLTDEQAKFAGQIAAMVFMTVLIIALSAPSMFVGGGAGAIAGVAGQAAGTGAGAAVVASQATEVATQSSLLVARALQIAAEIGGAVAGAGQGAAGIASSAYAYEGAMIEVDQKKIQAKMLEIQAMIDLTTDQLDKIIKDLQDTWSLVGNIVNSQYETTSNIVHPS